MGKKIDRCPKMATYYKGMGGFAEDQSGCCCDMFIF